MSERIFDVEPYAISTTRIDDASMRLIESMTSIESMTGPSSVQCVATGSAWEAATAMGFTR